MADTVILSVEPKSAPVGATVILTGMISTSDGEYHLYWNRPGTPPLLTQRASGVEVKDTFVVPPSESGSYQVILEDQATKATSGARFVVLPRLTLDTASCIVGSKITVSGTNYPRGKVSLRLDGNEVAIIAADSELKFETVVVVPPLTAGEHQLSTSPAGTVEVFKVTPRIAIDQTAVLAGAEIRVAGTGFPAQQVSVNYDGKEMVTARANERGEFEASFNAPSDIAGAHRVSTSPRSVTLSFTLVPRITSVVPSHGLVGQTAALSGENFVPGKAVSIRYGDAEVATAVPDDKGGLKAVFVVPPSVTGGHRITTDPSSTDYTFSVSPNIETRPRGGLVGSPVEISGTGFVHNRRVSLRYDDREVTTAAPDERGSFLTRFAVPASAGGEHTISSEPPSSERQFAVGPIIVIDPLAGPVGSTIKATATGFGARGVVSIRYDDREVVGASSDARGSADVTFAVPASTGGQHKVSTEPASAELAFIVSQTIAVQPVSGSVGSEVVVEGRGFGAGRRVSLRYDDREAAVAIADASGSLRGSLTIPASGGGEHKISTEPPSVEQSFTVKSQLLPVEPASGPVGTELKVAATGFAPGTRVIFKYGDREVSTAVADGLGNVYACPTVPASVGGAHTVTTLPASGEQVFTTAPALKVEPRNGHVGDQVAASGTGFPSGEVSIRYDAEQVATAVAGSDGSFRASFPVPSSAAGEHSITTGGELGLDRFVVSPALSVSPALGPAGTMVTLFGKGLPAGGVSVWYDDKEVASAVSDNGGRLEVAFRIPASTGGDHFITTRPASAKQVFKVGPSLVLSPERGIGVTTLCGSGFGSGSPIAVVVDGRELPTVPLQVLADAGGSFTAIIVIPATASGEYLVSAHGATQAAPVPEAAHAHFTIIDIRGSRGERGEQGPQGAAGPKGERGDQGSPGGAGAKGERGDQGSAGVAGAKGERGEQGPQGAAGLKGERGDQGSQGEPGAKGERGERGPQGMLGSKGDRGEQGPQGVPGLRGDRGEQGPQGVPGLKGDRGEQGPQGVPGPKGDRGEQGPQGEAGLKGDRGEQGPAGEKGKGLFGR